MSNPGIRSTTLLLELRCMTWVFRMGMAPRVCRSVSKDIWYLPEYTCQSSCHGYTDS